MKWRKGKPNAPGLWIVDQHGGDLALWLIEWDFPRKEPAHDTH